MRMFSAWWQNGIVITDFHKSQPGKGSRPCQDLATLNITKIDHDADPIF